MTMQLTEIEKHTKEFGVRYLNQMNSELVNRFSDNEESFAILLGSIATMVEILSGFVKTKSNNDINAINGFRDIILESLNK